jgi:hypothetical protein
VFDTAISWLVWTTPKQPKEPAQKDEGQLDKNFPRPWSSAQGVGCNSATSRNREVPDASLWIKFHTRPAAQRKNGAMRRPMALEAASGLLGPHSLQ